VGLIGLRNFRGNFLECGIGDEFKFQLVNWSRICASMKLGGGLGLRNLIQFN
jgi:hypothetical protein